MLLTWFAHRFNQSLKILSHAKINKNNFPWLFHSHRAFFFMVDFFLQLVLSFIYFLRSFFWEGINYQEIDSTKSQNEVKFLSMLIRLEPFIHIKIRTYLINTNFIVVCTNHNAKYTNLIRHRTKFNVMPIEQPQIPHAYAIIASLNRSELFATNWTVPVGSKPL